MSIFGNKNAYACFDCGVEGVAFPGSTCSPCAKRHDEEDREMRKREIGALERCAAALERLASPDPKVMAFEKHAARTSRSRSKPKAK